MFYVKVKQGCAWKTVVVASRIFVQGEEIQVADADMVEEIRRSELLEVREEREAGSGKRQKTFQEAKKLPGREREEVEG